MTLGKVNNSLGPPVCNVICVCALCIIRPHRSTSEMRPVVTDGVAWSVGQSICLSWSWALQKWLSWFRYGLWWARGSMY